MIAGAIWKRWLLAKFLFCKHVLPGVELVRKNSFGRIIVSYDWIGQNIYLDNYDKEEIQVYEKILEKDHVVLDVGANIGYYTLLFASLVRGGKVVSFEPSSRERRLLQKNVDLNRMENVTVVGLGLGATAATGELHINNSNFGRNSIGMVQSGPSERIEIETIDNYIRQNSLTRFDLIKLDVEGYEIEVLKGASESIQKFRPLVSFESWSTHNKHFHPDLSVEVAFLAALGYEFFQFRGLSALKVKEGDLVTSVNLIAVPKDRSNWLQSRLSQ